MYEVKFRPEEELEMVHEGLRAYNRGFFQSSEDLCCCIEDEAGVCIGGVLGWHADDLAMVDILWVDEKHRKLGLGIKLLSAVEEEAKRRGAKRIELNTFGFQAPRFYEKQGYRQFGKIEPGVGAYGHYFYVKELL
ncbi:MAG: GNAT family N-acetyltransferase [Clostridia bacterium]|nr:GNAT family N-acetyltransferase [Clostridia bacterium]